MKPLLFVLMTDDQVSAMVFVLIQIIMYTKRLPDVKNLVLGVSGMQRLSVLQTSDISLTHLKWYCAASRLDIRRDDW